MASTPPYHAITCVFNCSLLMVIAISREPPVLGGEHHYGVGQPSTGGNYEADILIVQ